MSYLLVSVLASGSGVDPDRGDLKPVEDGAPRQVAGPLGGTKVDFSCPLIKEIVFGVARKV